MTGTETRQPLPLFYKKVVALHREQHRGLYMQPLAGYGFSKETNSIYIAAVEFPKAANEYPIVFGTDASGAVFPVILLGLGPKQNLFVDEQGAWQADYIPAYVRRYPFILAAPDNDAGDFTVCIDEGYGGFNTAKEGQALFDEAGEQSEILRQAVDFLKDYQGQVQLTGQFCQQLAELGLLESMQANIEMNSGEKYALGGFQCVNRERLKALPEDKLAALIKSDQMELIFAHLHSLANVNVLLAKLG